MREGKERPAHIKPRGKEVLAAAIVAALYGSPAAHAGRTDVPHEEAQAVHAEHARFQEILHEWEALESEVAALVRAQQRAMGAQYSAWQIRWEATMHKRRTFIKKHPSFVTAREFERIQKADMKESVEKSDSALVKDVAPRLFAFMQRIVVNPAPAQKNSSNTTTDTAISDDDSLQQDRMNLLNAHFENTKPLITRALLSFSELYSRAYTFTTGDAMFAMLRDAFENLPKTESLVRSWLFDVHGEPSPSDADRTINRIDMYMLRQTLMEWESLQPDIREFSVKQYTHDYPDFVNFLLSTRTVSPIQ